MDKRQGNFIEQHIEKAAMATGVLVSAYILIAFVIQSPKIPIDQQKLPPGQIDSYISEKAEKLKQKLNREPNQGASYEPCVPSFINMLNGEWALDSNVSWPLPGAAETRIEKRYRIPEIGEVNDVSVEHIRAAAYIPKTELTAENAGNSSIYEANDIDFVTVEGNFDLGKLSDSFKDCFDGISIPEEWRNAELAKPVFAAVDVQRQELGSDGKWGEWEDIPRARVEPGRKSLEAPEEVNGLAGGGITVQILKMSPPGRQASLLQPDPYQIASGEDYWFPPTLHKKYLAQLREKEAQEKRDEIAANKEKEQQGKRPERRPRNERGGAGGGAAGSDMDAMMRAMSGGGGGGGSAAPMPSSTRGGRSSRERRQDSTTTDKSKTASKTAAKPAVKPAVKPATESSITDELDNMLLSKKDTSKPVDTITFWAYDDTVSPGGVYRYRVRIGVFNPVAGTGEVRQEDKALASKVILWSSFSEVTDEVEIPKRLYFFPMSVNETTKSVDWTVSKYVMGYWHSEQFTTKRGEVIGKTAEVKPDAGQTDKKNSKEPDQIDYTTGAVLVDVVASQDWTGDKNLAARPYFNVLYSYDGSEIEESAAKPMNWTDDLRARYNEIKTLEKNAKEVVLREWNSNGTLAKRTLKLPTGQNRQQTGPAGPAGTPQDSMMQMMMEMQKQMTQH